VREEERPALEALLERGTRNGVPLRMITAAEAHALEPNVRSVAALYSPSTGIVSAHELMDDCARRAEAAGAVLKMRSEVIGIERRSGDYVLTVKDADQAEPVSAERVVNAAGLGSDTIAALAGIDVDAAGYRLHYCKGTYFALAPSRWGLVSRLVYPVPGNESLGVHAVIDVGGRVRFGPDVEYLPARAIDYGVDEGRRAAFGEAARRFLPGVADEDLSADISGVRAKLQAKGAAVRDFVIQEEGARGLPGFVNLIGIDSPGLTASLAIAEEVETLIG
jgi:L-2-hydroxyglutarate oxidase LhgO